MKGVHSAVINLAKTGSGRCRWQDDNQQATMTILQSSQTFQGLFNQSPAADEEVGGQRDEPAPPITLETPTDHLHIIQ